MSKTKSTKTKKITKKPTKAAAKKGAAKKVKVDRTDAPPKVKVARTPKEPKAREPKRPSFDMLPKRAVSASISQEGFDMLNRLMDDRELTIHEALDKLVRVGFGRLGALSRYTSKAEKPEKPSAEDDD